MSMKRSYKALLTASLAAAVFGAPYSLTFADTSGSTDVKLSIDPTLSIALSTNNVEFDIDTPNLLTNNMTVTGATNSANGYTISVNANNAYTSLKHEDQGVSENIPTLSEVSSVASFPNVAWGYTNSLNSMSDEVSGSTNFRPISQSATNVFETSAYGSSSHIFTTGVKVGSTIPAGAYSNDLLFTIVANYVEEPEEPLVPYTDVAITRNESLLNRKYSSAIDPLFHNEQPSDFTANYSGNVFSATGAFTGDYYDAISQWLIDVTNIGSTDAMFAGAPIITGLTDEQKEFMEARITYEYGTQMRKGDLLRSGETESILVRIQYKDGYSGPLHTNENISLSIEFPYAVANNIARKAKDGEGWVYMPNTFNYVYSNDNITMLDWRRPSDGRSEVFPRLKDDGVIVSFQVADDLDLSNAVTLDSGEKFYDLSIKRDGSVLGWFELNEDGIDYDGPQYSDNKFYDYYVYSTIGKVVVDACDDLFKSWGGSEFGFASKLDLHGLDLERCTSTHNMFRQVGSIANGYSGYDVDIPFVLDLGDWTGENLLVFYDTFIDAGRNHPNGAEIIFSDNFNPINLRNAMYVFHFFAAETENVTVDISGWDLSNLLDASFMFADLAEDSTGTITINMEGVTTPRLVNANSMFYNIGSLDASRVVINAPDLTFDNVTNMGYMFSTTCGRSISYPDTICDINMKLKTPNVTNMNRMFQSTGNLIGSPDLDLSEFDTSSVTDMGEMFSGAWIEKVIEKVDFDNFDTSNVSNMASMFSSRVGDPSIESLTIDLSHFNTPSLTKANYFLTLSNIYTPGVSYTYNLKYVTIDISNFDFSGVTDITGSYARLLQLPNSLEKATVYVKDQAAKDFVENHVIIYNWPEEYYQFQDGDVVIK